MKLHLLSARLWSRRPVGSILIHMSSLGHLRVRGAQRTTLRFCVREARLLTLEGLGSDGLSRESTRLCHGSGVSFRDKLGG